MTDNGTRGAAVVHYAAVLLAAAVIGVAVAEIPWQLSALIIAAALTVAALGLVRMLVRPAPAALTPDLEGGHVEDRRFRFARLAYYAGAATIGFLTIRPAMGFTASDWIFLASLGLAVLVILLGGLGLPYLLPQAITVGAVLFALGGLLSSVNAVAQVASAMVVIRVLYLTLVWFWLGTVVLQTREHVENALIAWVCSAALSSTGAVIQFFQGDVIPGGVVSWGRMSGFTEHFNVLGGLTATAFVPALMLAVDSRRGSLRAVGFVASGLIGAGLLLSGSVGGLLAASVATILWLALRGASLRMVLSLSVVVAAGFVLMSATGAGESPSPVQRVTRVTSAEQAAAGTGGTVYTRLEGWADAWARIREQPFVGVGLDAASSGGVLGPHSVHNMILSPWFTAGILGLVGVIMIVGGSLAVGMRVLRYSPRHHRSFAAAILAAAVAFVQHGMGEPILYVRYGWLPSALLVALWAQRKRAQARAPHAVSSLSAPAYSLGRAGWPSASK